MTRHSKRKRQKSKVLICFLCTFAVLILSYSIWANLLTQSNERFLNVHIRPDGTIDPNNAPIARSGNQYLLTKDLIGTIIIERDNVILDGCGHVLRGTLNGTIGIDIDERRDVVISNITIQGFNFGMVISNSSRITVLNVTFAGNYFGMMLSESSECVVHACNVTGDTYCGIWILLSNNNKFYENIIQGVTYGVKLELSIKNIFRRNMFVQNAVPILTDDQSADNEWKENSVLRSDK